MNASQQYSLLKGDVCVCRNEGRKRAKERYSVQNSFFPQLLAVGKYSNRFSHCRPEYVWKGINKFFRTDWLLCVVVVLWIIPFSTGGRDWWESWRQDCGSLSAVQGITLNCVLWQGESWEWACCLSLDQCKNTYLYDWHLRPRMNILHFSDNWKKLQTCWSDAIQIWVWVYFR